MANDQDTVSMFPEGSYKAHLIDRIQYSHIHPVLLVFDTGAAPKKVVR